MISRTCEQTARAKNMVLRMLMASLLWHTPDASSALAHADDPDQEMIQLARAIVRDAEANLARVKTWSGSVTVQREQVRKKHDLKIESTAKIDFVYERSSSRAQSRSQITHWKASETLEVNPVSTEGHVGGCLWTPDRSYFLKLQDPAKKVVEIRAGVAQPTPKPSHDTPELFHPLVFLKEPGSDRLPAAELKMMSDALPDALQKQLNVKLVSKQPGLIEIEFASVRPRLRVVRQYDRAVGGNMLRQRHEIERKQGEQEHGRVVVQWTQVNGVWLPEEWLYEKTKDAFGISTDRVRIKWVRQAVNERLPADAFTLEYMGVQSGDALRTGDSQVTYDGSNSGVPQPGSSSIDHRRQHSPPQANTKQRGDSPGD